MLDSLRRHATGWVAKVLFGILVLSFAIWGIGDIFRAPHGGGTVAEVAGTDITVQEVSREFDSRVAQMQEQFGANLDRRGRASLGVMQQAVDASRGAPAGRCPRPRPRADRGRRHGCRQRSADNPALPGRSAGSSASASSSTCGSIGMSEADYVEAVRGDMVRNDLIGAMTGTGAARRRLLARKLVEYRMEQRRGAALVVDAATIEVPAPSEEALTRLPRGATPRPTRRRSIAASRC